MIVMLKWIMMLAVIDGTNLPSLIPVEPALEWLGHGHALSQVRVRPRLHRRGPAAQAWTCAACRSSASQPPGTWSGHLRHRAVYHQPVEDRGPRVSWDPGSPRKSVNQPLKHGECKQSSVGTSK